MWLTNRRFLLPLLLLSAFLFNFLVSADFYAALPVSGKPGYRGKRLFDILGALAALVVLSPLMLALAVLVYVTHGAPVIFRQQRPGLNARPFTIYKFRTMTNARDAQGHLLPDAQRLTRLGSWMRRTSLDELPELWNVLRGDMSLVGPRPLLMQYLERYTPEQAQRHCVKPGITGWAQVNGRNGISWPDKFALDNWYIAHMSWALDAAILWRTAEIVLRQRGINQPGQMTVSEFTGA